MMLFIYCRTFKTGLATSSSLLLGVSSRVGSTKQVLKGNLSSYINRVVLYSNNHQILKNFNLKTLPVA